jgi:site-specific DNA-cytosine methylase
MAGAVVADANADREGRMTLRVVDYFAGLGGFTLGATRAGARVVRAIDHWPVAVRLHAEISR